MRRTRRLQLIFMVYWIMLAYILAALIWWFIELNNQNTQITALKIRQLTEEKSNLISRQFILENEKRKTAQYIGEGAFFLLLITSAAIYIYRAFNRQFRQTLEQQNFMMAITHELKTPIAVTQLNLETLLKRSLNEEQQRRLITTTLQETTRLNSLCNNMLLTSQIDAGGYKMIPETINLSNTVKSSINEFTIRFPDRIFNTGVKEEIVFQGDPLLMQMAVNNLIDNALKYSPRNSVVSVELFHNENIVLVVSDEGEGISESEKIKVMQKYYRTGNTATQHAKGTGLGLYLIGKIVKAHKGKIQIDDNIPKGCRFVITLPLST